MSLAKNTPLRLARWALAECMGSYPTLELSLYSSRAMFLPLSLFLYKMGVERRGTGPEVPQRARSPHGRSEISFTRALALTFSCLKRCYCVSIYSEKPSLRLGISFAILSLDMGQGSA